MTYDRQILRILSDVGEQGISVQLLAKHVYNQNVSLFFTPDIDEIRSYVQQYLLKNSKSPASLVESMERRGYYRLNTRNNADARQLLIEFRQDSSSDEKRSSEYTSYASDETSSSLETMWRKSRLAHEVQESNTATHTNNPVYLFSFIVIIPSVFLLFLLLNRKENQLSLLKPLG